MIYLSFMLILSSFACLATEVDFSRVESKPVSKFLKRNPTLSAFKASCISLNNCMGFEYKGASFTNEDYERHEKSYQLDVSRDEFLNVLLNSHPKDIWSGDSVFQLSFNKRKDLITYRDDNHSGLEVGELIVLELHLRLSLNTAVLSKIPVAFQIVEVDKDKGTLAFSYAKDNKSKGIQHLTVTERNGKAYVKHVSRYLSGQNFRDSNLYDPFHERLLDDFYPRLESLIKARR